MAPMASTQMTADPAAARAPVSAPVAELLQRPVMGVVLLAVTCLVVFGLNLGTSFLWEPDEGRNAQIARQMLESGRWLIPVLDDRFHDKPALFYWLLVVAGKVFGLSEWALRLPSVVAAALGVIATAAWGARYLDRLTGLLAALMLATAGAYIAFGRVVMIDATFAWWLVAAFFYGSAWILEGPQCHWPRWPFYLLVSLATLTKGPVALVLAAITFTVLGWRARVSPRQVGLATGVAVVLLVGGGWYLAATVVAPAYVWDFLWVQNVQRFAAGRGGHQLNPFAYFYLLPAVFLPWSLYLPAAIVRTWQSGRLSCSLPLQCCALWFVTVFTFFSFSDAKIVTYLLPAFPALALLLADALADTIRRCPLTPVEALLHRAAFVVVAALLAAAPAAALVFLWVFAPDHLGVAMLLLGGVPAAVVGWRWLQAGRYDFALCTVWAVTLLTSTLVYAVGPRAVNGIYSLGGAAAVVRRAAPRPRLYAYDAKTYSFEFYTDGRVSRLRDLDQAVAALASQEPTVLLTKESQLDDLNDRLPGDAYVWWRGQRTKVLVGNRPPPG